MQNPPRLDRLTEPICAAESPHRTNPERFLGLLDAGGASPKSRSGKGQSGGFGPSGAFFKKNAS
jgi:hypothetical protein